MFLYMETFLYLCTRISQIYIQISEKNRIKRVWKVLIMKY